MATERAGPYLDSYPDATRSAEVIVPVVLELLGHPRTVIDLGGGIGAWGGVLKARGVKDYKCIDDPAIGAHELKVPPEDFIGCDLSSRFPDPIPCDVAVSLEFAEHVDRARSRDIVRFLVSSAPIVLFSASIPGQPGVHHVNEQPPGYWKALFQEHGYRQHDIVRPRIAGMKAIPYWYRQNMLVYANEEASARLVPLAMPFEAIPDEFELVHERILKIYRDALRPMGLRQWLRGFPAVVGNALRRRSAGSR